MLKLENPLKLEDLNKNNKMNFKPTKWKIIVSIVVVVGWILLMQLMMPSAMCECLRALSPCESNYLQYTLVRPICAECGCTSFIQMLSINLRHIIIPFIIRMHLVLIQRIVFTSPLKEEGYTSNLQMSWRIIPNFRNF